MNLPDLFCQSTWSNYHVCFYLNYEKKPFKRILPDKLINDNIKL